MNSPDTHPGNAGFTMVELLMVVAIIGLLAAVAVPLYSGALDKSQRSALIQDAFQLHRSFMRYHVDNAVFPSTFSPASRALDLKTLAPLSTGGYFTAVETLMDKLQGGQIQNYDSPNVGGADTQFWATLSSSRQPGFVLLVAHTNDLPFDRGTWYDGVFYVTSDGLEPVRKTR